MKIILNMIVRDSAATIERCLDSLKPGIDFAVIGFAGQNSDDTVAVTRAWLEKNMPGAYVTEEFEFEDFAKSRNRVLEITPNDDPDAWLIWADGDDVVRGIEDLRNIIAQLKPEIGCLRFPYIYQQDENGNPQVIHDRERVVRMSLGWYWLRPVHETLNARTEHQIARFDTLTWVHDWKRNQQDRSPRNLALLMQALEDEPNDRRNPLYIAHSFYSNEQWEEAMGWFGNYFMRPENDWEQWQAAVFAGDCAFQLEDFDLATSWYMQAIDVAPPLMDPYLGIAACYVRKEEYEKALIWYDMAEGKGLPPSGLFVLPGRYTFNRWAYEHYALASAGRYLDALEICLKALQYSPNHDGFSYYAHGYRAQIDKLKSLQAMKHLVLELQNRGDALAAFEILKYAPKSITEEAEFEALKNYAYKAVEHLFVDEANEHVYGGGTDVDATNMPWDHLTAYDPTEESRFKVVADELKKLAEKKKASGNDQPLTVVDLGCGDGLFPVWLAKQGYLVTGVDSIPQNIERALKLAQMKGLSDSTRFICADARSLNLEEIGSHDVAICCEVIEHVREPALVLGNCLDLAPECFVTTPHILVGDELNNTPDGVHLHHVREFDFDMMVRLGAMLGSNIETIRTVYAKREHINLPGYGQWFMHLTRNPERGITKPPIVFYVGAGLKWTPDDINGVGLGGSETAVVRMAREFRNAGHPVFVYGPVNGVWDGVFYTHAKHFNADGPAGGAPALLFVSSRIPELFDVKINAATKWLWAHDANFQNGGIDRLTPERAKEINSILVLSEWQKREFATLYPFAKKQLVVTANGIDANRFDGLENIERHPHRFVWSSSFDRGLERVLTMWPEIKAAWDDAELHIFYGWDTAKKLGWMQDPVFAEFVDRLNALMDQDGVVYHGMTPQSDLPKQFAAAGFWLYPTSFTETYCITAVEVQACGVIPVTSNVGALPERMMKDWPTFSDEDDDDVYITRLMQCDPARHEEARAALRENALKNTWARVHEQWQKLLGSQIEVIAKQREITKGGNQDLHAA